MNMPNPTLSIVIPTYREEKRIGPTLSRLIGSADTFGLTEIIVVENGSSDGTERVVRSADSDAHFAIHYMRSDPGKGRAVRAGMTAASGDVRLYSDADLAVPPTELARLRQSIVDGYDVAFGSRQAPGGLRVGESAHRHLAGRAFNRLIQSLVLPGISDSQCGAKAFNSSTAATIFNECITDGFGFDVEVLALARKHAMRVIELGVEWHAVEGGTIRVRRDAAAMLREVIAIRRRVGKQIHHPLGT